MSWSTGSSEGLLYDALFTMPDLTEPWPPHPSVEPPLVPRTEVRNNNGHNTIFHLNVTPGKDARRVPPAPIYR